jgi:hypothetical protein
MDNSNPNFSFTTNLSGIRAASGGGIKLPEGFYTGSVTDAFQTTSKNGRPQVAIKITLGGQFEGTVRTSWVGIPTSADDNLRYFWRAIFESLGYTPAQIDQGDIGVSREVLVGRNCSIYYKPGDKDMGIYEELKFLSPNDFTQQKAQFDAAVVAPNSALGSTGGIAGIGGSTAAPVTAPTNGVGIGGNTVSKEGLLAALNR